MRWPGVEPGSTAWKATMLTVTPPTLSCGKIRPEFDSPVIKGWEQIYTSHRGSELFD